MTVVLAVLSSLVPMLSTGTASAAARQGSDVRLLNVGDYPDPVFVNAGVTYQVEVGNVGPSPATGVRVSTQLPATARFEPAASDSSCAAAGDIVTCSYPSLDVNAVRIVLITVTPMSAGSLQLTFTVSAAEPDPDLSNNSQTETTQVVQPTEADLSVNVPDSVLGYAGDVIWYSVEVRNAGPATATGAIATLELPQGLSPTSPVPCAATEMGLSCTYAFGTVPPQAGLVALLQLRASAAGSYTVQATASADQPDPSLSNNTDSGLVEVRPTADMSVRIHESADPSIPGQPLTYTVTIDNLGPSPAATVSLVDTWSTTMAGGVELLSFTTSQGQCSLAAGQSIDCSFGELASGASATVTVRLRPRGTGSVTDQAQVFAELDRNTANNTAVETTTVAPA